MTNPPWTSRKMAIICQLLGDFVLIQVFNDKPVVPGGPNLDQSGFFLKWSNLVVAIPVFNFLSQGQVRS